MGMVVVLVVVIVAVIMRRANMEMVVLVIFA